MTSERPQTEPATGADHALRVVESMTSGVVTLDPEGRVTAINQRAARIIGVDRDGIMGQSLVAVLLEDPANEHLTDTIVEASYDSTGRYHRQVELHQGERRRTLDLRASLLRDADGAMAGVVLVIDDVTETAILRASEQRLAEELRVRNDKLTEAYRGLEEKTRTIADTRRRVRRFGVAALAVALIVAGGAGWYAWTADAPPARPRPVAGTPGEAPGLTVQPRRLRQTVAISGTIEPGKVVEVTAPFAGAILARDFVYGARVEQGQELLRIDGGDVERDRRKAVAAAMNARQKLDDLINWERGNEVQRARRQLAQVRQSLERAEQQMQTAAELLKRGIIARQEHDSLVQQQRQMQLQVFSSEQDLAATLRKGSPDQVEIARLDLATANEQLAELTRKLAGAHILAPVAGVALRPRVPAGGSGGGGAEGAAGRELAVGGRVEQGRTILEIGDLSFLAVRGQVDEVDVGRVRPGLAVNVTSAGFGGRALPGQVEAVSSQASAERSGRSARPRFDVLIAVRDLPEAERQRLRIGMSAAVEIVLYENPAAILLPPDRIRRGPQGPVARVRRAGQGEPQDAPLTLGISMPEGIEVTAGLAPGDVVVAP